MSTFCAVPSDWTHAQAEAYQKGQGAAGYTLGWSSSKLSEFAATTPSTTPPDLPATWTEPDVPSGSTTPNQVLASFDPDALASTVAAAEAATDLASMKAAFLSLLSGIQATPE